MASYDVTKESRVDCKAFRVVYNTLGVILGIGLNETRMV